MHVFSGGFWMPDFFEWYGMGSPFGPPPLAIYALPARQLLGRYLCHFSSLPPVLIAAQLEVTSPPWNSTSPEGERGGERVKKEK